MKPHYKTIFFDLDDTLLDTQENNKKAMYQIFTELKWNKHFTSFEEYFQVYAPINKTLWHQYEQGYISKEQLMTDRIKLPLLHHGKISLTNEEALEIHQNLFIRMGLHNSLIAGAQEILTYLHDKYQLVIISNGFKEAQYKKIKGAAIEKFFSHIILSDHIGVNKPHPDIFQHALTISQTNRNESIMIGDNWSSDIVGAHKANISQIWYNPHHKPIQHFSPTHIIRTLKEIKNIL